MVGVGKGHEVVAQLKVEMPNGWLWEPKALCAEGALVVLSLSYVFLHFALWCFASQTSPVRASVLNDH